MNLNLEGPVYMKRHATPGEIECCSLCADLRTRQSEITPAELTVLHRELHVEWVRLGHTTAAVELESPETGERGLLIGPADKLAEIVRPEAVVDYGARGGQPFGYA